MRTLFPKQRLSFKEKKANDYQWAKEFVNSIIRFHDDDFCDNCDETKSGRENQQHRRVKNMLANYRLFNNQLDQSDFLEYCDNLGIREALGVTINEIKPYNKTYNKIQVLLGEEWKRPDNQKVVLVNAEGIKSKIDHKNKLYTQYIQFELQKVLFDAKSQFPELSPESYQSQEEYDKAMQEQEQQIQQKANEVMDPEEIEKYMKTKYLHQKEIMCGDLLNYLYNEQDIKQKKNDGFKHGNISGEEHVWVGVVNGQPVVETLNPLKVFYHKSSEVRYVQKGMYAGYRTHMTINDVLDHYADDLKDKDKDKLEERYSSKISNADSNLISSKMTYGDQNTIEFKYADNQVELYGSYGPSSYDDIEVVHVEWVSQRKTGFLEFIDPQTGLEVEKKIDESFSVPTDAKKISIREDDINTIKYIWFDEQTETQYSLEWIWIPEVWEATRIDNDIFVNIGPKENQHYSLDNPFSVKLGYHGVVYNNMNAPSQSTMDKMKPYQYLYFIAMDKFKKTMSQDKGRVIGIDSSRLDPKFPIEKTIHFLETAGYYVYNGLQGGDIPGAGQRPGIESIDGSNLANVMNVAQVLSWLDEQIGEAAGVTKQREGGTSPYEAVGNNQQSIIQSSHITEPLFIAHENLWKEIKQSLIEVAEVAYRKRPLRTQYILNDGSRNILNVDEELFENASYGIFTADSTKETKVFDELRGLIQPMINSDRAEMRDIINILTSDSVQELKRELITAEDQRIKREQEAQQSQQESAQQIEQMRAEQMKENRAHEVKLKTMDGEIALGKAEIESKRFMLAQDVNQNQVPDALEIEKLKLEEEKTSVEVKEAAKDRKHESIENEKDREVEREKIAAQKQIAKSRPKSKS